MPFQPFARKPCKCGRGCQSNWYRLTDWTEVPQKLCRFGRVLLPKDILNLCYLCRYFRLPEVAEYWGQVIRMNEYQKERFVTRILDSMFNTVSGKRIAILGYAFKKDTNDTREPCDCHLQETTRRKGTACHL